MRVVSKGLHGDVNQTRGEVKEKGCDGTFGVFYRHFEVPRA